MTGTGRDSPHLVLTSKVDVSLFLPLAIRHQAGIGLAVFYSHIIEEQSLVSLAQSVSVI